MDYPEVQQLRLPLDPELTAHGCFGEYLARFKKRQSLECVDCVAALDDAKHTLLSATGGANQERPGSQSRGINGARNHSWYNVGEQGEVENS